MPDAALLWMVFLGIGQGGALGLGLILPVLRGRDPGQVAGMTAMAMGVGYLIAAAGPGDRRRRARRDRRLDVADHRADRHDRAAGPGGVESRDALADRHGPRHHQLAAREPLAPHPARARDLGQR